MRGRMQDQMTLECGKLVWINWKSFMQTSLSFLIEVSPKSFPPQCIKMTLGAGPTFARVLSFCSTWDNFRPLYPCHHNEIFSLFRFRWRPPGLKNASNWACFSIEDPTNHTFCLSTIDKQSLWVRILVCECMTYNTKISIFHISELFPQKNLAMPIQC